MTTTVIAAVVMTPIILLPVAFVGYLTIGGIYGAIKGTGESDQEGSDPGLGIANQRKKREPGSNERVEIEKEKMKWNGSSS